MARLAAAAKGNYYPIPPRVIDKILEYVKPPDGGFSLLDPCAGQGAALKQLAEGLKCDPSDVYGIELDERRAEDVRAALPNANLLVPCSFFGCAINARTFQSVYCNPPFDTSEAGGSGNRVETDFLARATQILAPKGILILVIPQATAESRTTRQHILSWYDDIAEMPFPADCRKYREVVIFGVKRRDAVPDEKMHSRQWDSARWGGIVGTCAKLDPQAQGDGRYTIPSGLPPTRFEKTEPTTEEIRSLLAVSPLRRHLEPPAQISIARPPLALGKGHLAMLLASGQTDGLVAPEGQPPHVVRGTARKVEYVSDVKESKSSTTTTYSQKIQLVVRLATPDGKIITLEQK